MLLVRVLDRETRVGWRCRRVDDRGFGRSEQKNNEIEIEIEIRAIAINSQTAEPVDGR